MSLKARIFPELTRFHSGEERRAAWDHALGDVLRRPLFYLFLFMIVCCLAYGMSHLGRSAPGRWWVQALPQLLLYLLVPLISAVAFRRTVRQSLRKQLADQDVPICINCGYDLRGSEDRCPECGTDFSNQDTV